MQVLIGMFIDQLVHEMEKLAPPSSRIMARANLTGSDVEGSKQGGGSMPLVIVTEASQGSAVGKLQIPLPSLQGLNVGLFRRPR